jgi:phospholipid/cholesterol/gamma-HCH transport system permease protein
MTDSEISAAGIKPTLTQTTDGEVLKLSFTGDWLLQGQPSDDLDIETLLDGAFDVTRIRYDTEALGEWDTGLITVLANIQRFADLRQVENDTANIPAGAQSLLQLAFAVKEREGARREVLKTGFLERLGNNSLEVIESSRELVSFVGELALSTRRLSRGKATFRSSEAWLCIQEAGAEALPIVGHISFLIGMIFAFVGVMQLQNFGAGIYTADLVAVAMVREMAPIMTAIIMAGRTGAAYAAQIGTMKVNEEIDALKTLGLEPVDVLVTPRVIALVLMMPLFTRYSSLMGIIGGLAVGVVMLDISMVQYVVQTVDAVGLNSLFGGLFKSIIYGSLVALAGCQQGMACGNSAMAVGQSTTKAVVMGIVLIVVSASVLTVIYINLGI